MAAITRPTLPLASHSQPACAAACGVAAWAVGVLIYELLVGFPPFNDKNRPAVEEKIRADTPRFPAGMSEGARTFIGWVLQKDPAERPTIVDMMHHPFVQSTQRTLAPAPTSRAKSKGPIPALVDDDAETVIRPKASMQSFTAGKAPQVSNKAMTPQSRHMELPHLNIPAAASAGSSGNVGPTSPSYPPLSSVNSMESGGSGSVHGHVSGHGRRGAVMCGTQCGPRGCTCMLNAMQRPCWNPSLSVR